MDSLARAATGWVGSLTLAAVLAAGVAPTVSAQQPAAETAGWDLYGAVYGWMSSVTGTVALGPFTDFPINEDFSDLAKNLDLGFSARFEAHAPGGWLLFGDVFYADLGAEGFSADSSVAVAVDQKELILEAGAGYEVLPRLEMLVLARYNDLRLTAGVTGNEPVTGGTRWLDLFGGVRYTPWLGDKWLLILRGDAGGGGSRFSWFGSAVVNYWFGESTSASLGYRILSVDRQEGTGFDQLRWDVVMHGLSLGVVFAF